MAALSPAAAVVTPGQELNIQVMVSAMASDQPLHTQLYAVMADRIRSGVWKEGEKVPSEQSLVEEFGTSRGPVRQALARLRTEELIVGGRGAPPRVQKTIPSQSFDTYISFTEWAEELGRVPSQKTIEVARRLADERAAHDLGVPESSPVIEIVRLRMFDSDPIMLERGTYTIQVGEHLLNADLDRSSIYQILREHGIFPTRAHNVIDAVPAGEFDAHWLEVEPGSPLLRVRRIAYAQDGSIVDIAENRYLPSKATFAIENTRFNHSPIARLTVDTTANGLRGGMISV